MWNQRPKALWIKWGDRNTKFFHATTSQRRRRNRIIGLQDSDGVWQEDQGCIESTILEYFANIFKSDHRSPFEASLDAIDTRVSSEMNDELLADFKADKATQAIKQMHPTKSPRPDSMSSIFYQNYWDLVGRFSIKITGI